MNSTTEITDPIRIAFMCVQNAGRSQMATAFGEQERNRRGLDDRVEILTGGTQPAENVHEEVISVMGEAGFDLSDRIPREITIEELRSCDYVATMGCSTLDVAERSSAANQNAKGSGDVGTVGNEVDLRDWELDDPAGQSPERVREIRDEIEERVRSLFDEFDFVESEEG